jgi:hypothetical protein
MTTSIPAEFKLANIVRTFFDNNDWSYEVAERKEPTHLIFRSHTYVDNQTYSIIIETSEKQDTVEFFMYFPFRVHPARVHDLVVILNRINIVQRLGRFAIWDDDDHNAIQWKGAIDVEGGELAADQIDTLCSAGITACRHYLDVLSRVALTPIPANEAWKDFLENAKQTKADELEEVPTEL